MKSYNKGEWSEPYLLLKLIVDQKLYLGKENFEKVENTFYKIIKILHFERDNNTEFSFEGDLVLVKGKEENFRIPIKKFIDICTDTLTRIGSIKSNDGTFSMPRLMEFLNSINIREVKAKSSSKQDITLQIEDPNTFISPILGFSIKSQLGSPSTLVNASNSTNFIYRVTKKLSKQEVDKINSERKFSDKFKLLQQFGSEAIYESVQSPKFRINLQTIDFNFHKLLSDMVLMYYKNDNPSKNSIEAFTSELTKRNEFNYDLDLNSEIYEMIVKRFLVEYALGMRAAKIWKRDYEADGGYLIVREDGEVVCYHFYFIKNFENYLFQNTKLETPSASRYHMFEIYEEEGFQKFTLNLQIRFIN